MVETERVTGNFVPCPLHVDWSRECTSERGRFVQTLLVFLVVRGVGKLRSFVKELPKHAQESPEAAILYAPGESGQ